MSDQDQESRKALTLLARLTFRALRGEDPELHVDGHSWGGEVSARYEAGDGPMFIGKGGSAVAALSELEDTIHRYLEAEGGDVFREIMPGDPGESDPAVDLEDGETLQELLQTINSRTLEHGRQLNKHDGELRDLGRDLETLHDRFRDFTDELDLRELLEKRSQLRNVVADLQDDLERLRTLVERKVKTLPRRISNVQAGLRELPSEADFLKARDRIEELESHKDQLYRIVEKLENGESDTERRLQDLESDLEDLRLEVGSR